MKWLFVLIAAVGVAAGINYNGLRVRYGVSEALKDKEYFFSIPRTVSLAESEGWRRVERPAGPLPELRAYCRPDDINMCPLYDQGGYIVGLQIALATDVLQSVPYDPAKKFIKWRDQTVGDTKKDYWTANMYFASEESLKRGAGPRSESGTVLQDGAIWVTNPAASNKLVQIPLQEVDLAKTLYKKENCVRNMGTHYFYNMTKELVCADFLPWFVLVKEGQVIGAGFQIFGKTQKAGEREWFETINSTAARMIVPTAPDCLFEWADTYGITTLHTYFIEEPWNIKCEAGDSLQTM